MSHLPKPSVAIDPFDLIAQAADDAVFGDHIEQLFLDPAAAAAALTAAAVTVDDH